ISFSVVNEMLPTTSPGPYTLRLYTDNPTITLKAKQTGTAGEASFNYNWLAVCGGGSSPPPPPISLFSITGVTPVSCATVTAGERRLTFTPQYAGVTGQPISFSVVNEMLPTTSPGPYTLRLYTDNPTITLKAKQTGTVGEASFNYNWLAVCNGGGAPRLGASLEPTAKLQVKLLGNPLREAVEVEVRGGENRPLHLSLTDMMGRVVGESRTERASASEHYRFDVSTLSPGALLLRTSTQGQTEVVRVLKTE
ncbi:MAG: C-terminal target protein, partial [Spirosoma sp.]|nr:C-terminal target protein [Spirosoma sp.]